MDTNTWKRRSFVKASQNETTPNPNILGGFWCTSRRSKEQLKTVSMKQLRKCNGLGPTTMTKATERTNWKKLSASSWFVAIVLESKEAGCRTTRTGKVALPRQAPMKTRPAACQQTNNDATHYLRYYKAFNCTGDHTSEPNHPAAGPWALFVEKRKPERTRKNQPEPVW